MVCCHAVLNSWGAGDDTGNARKNGGVTKDGMFRIQMGLAGEWAATQGRTGGGGFVENSLPDFDLKLSEIIICTIYI